MPKRTNDFQKLVYLVQLNLADGSEVKESKLLRDRLTRRLREVDVVIRGELAGHPVVVSIECRAHKRAADVTWIDAMKAKHDRLPTNVLILCSSPGFTKEAQDVAEKYGIGLFTLENQTAEDVQILLGREGALWIKTFKLSAEKVRVNVAETVDLQSETVVTNPNNLLYDKDGNELGQLRTLVDLMLGTDYVKDYMAKEGIKEHIRFELRWDNPTGNEDQSIFMMKLDPKVLRKVEWIHIQGPCEVDIGEFGLRYGRLGMVRVAWGKTQVAGREAMLVATVSEEGDEKLSINFSGSPSEKNQPNKMLESDA